MERAYGWDPSIDLQSSARGFAVDLPAHIPDLADHVVDHGLISGNEYRFSIHGIRMLPDGASHRYALNQGVVRSVSLAQSGESVLFDVIFSTAVTDPQLGVGGEFIVGINVS